MPSNIVNSEEYAKLKKQGWKENGAVLAKGKLHINLVSKSKKNPVMTVMIKDEDEER